jgi:dTDP-glucose pyrophosphorylase/mRNA-degrading endonuclease RelE of RelBE toxin-antitoxin system
MRKPKDHIIYLDTKIKDALVRLNDLNLDNILFVVDSNSKLVGTITDGDIRRGLIKGIEIESCVERVIQKEPKYIIKGQNNLEKIIELREGNYKIIPVVDNDLKIISVINFRKIRSYLPVDAVIMSGGRGQRLQPLTDTIPKPLLKVGDKTIIEHNLDRLALFGIDDFWISLRYLGEQIENKLGKGEDRNVNIEYIWEREPLGTIGAVSKINNFHHENILVTNSDLLTNVDYEKFFLEFLSSNADLAVLTIPYQVDVPYAVLETKNGVIKSLKEKPTYTYYSNGGIYLIKRHVLKYIPDNTFFNSTDLIESLIENNYKVVSYPFSGYWLDIGKHEDFQRAQTDINYLAL